MVFHPKSGRFQRCQIENEMIVPCSDEQGNFVLIIWNVILNISLIAVQNLPYCKIQMLAALQFRGLQAIFVDSVCH